MSHGVRVEDIAWQAFQAARNPLSYSGTDSDDSPDERIREAFRAWWKLRTDQGCALPACERCGYDPGAKVSARWSFVIDRDPPSLNDRLFNAADPVGRRRYRKQRDMWIAEMMVGKVNNRVPSARVRRRVTLTRMFAGRQQLRDVDNNSGGMKVVVDAMAHVGLLVDDSAAWSEIHHAQLRGEARGLHILIEELA